MALKLSETYREVIQELFDMEQLLDYTIIGDIGQEEDKWWEEVLEDGMPLSGLNVLEGEIKYEVDEGEQRKIDFVMDLEDVYGGERPKFRFSIMFKGQGGEIDKKTNDQKAIEILNTLSHIIINFIKDNKDFFDNYGAEIKIHGVRETGEEDETTQRSRVYSKLIQKHIDKLEGDWVYDKDRQMLKN